MVESRNSSWEYKKEQKGKVKDKFKREKSTVSKGRWSKTHP